ncbi:MAG: TetR/AcrR family transcriptional regulator [Proteobacteria bacterium]|nr:TetR/AcrR family transcriptional regulator [Pseudomonadota bacterium]
MSRRTAILAAAIDLFAERGYASTPTAELAQRAGVAEGTIFHHFRTKDGVLRELLVDLLDRYLQGAEEAAAAAATGLEALERLVLFHFSFAAERTRELLVVLRDVPYRLVSPESESGRKLLPRFARVAELFADGIDRGKTDGTIREVPTAEAAFLLRSLLTGLSRQRLLGPLAAPAPEGLQVQVLDFLRRSLALYPESAQPRSVP